MPAANKHAGWLRGRTRERQTAMAAMMAAAAMSNSPAPKIVMASGW